MPGKKPTRKPSVLLQSVSQFVGKKPEQKKPRAPRKPRAKIPERKPAKPFKIENKQVAEVHLKQLEARLLGLMQKWNELAKAYGRIKTSEQTIKMQAIAGQCDFIRAEMGRIRAALEEKK